jgi:hypothetical protein
MKRIRSRRDVVVLLVAFAVGAGSILAATPAPADLSLFRVERRFIGRPFPGINITSQTPNAPNPISKVSPYGSPGGAGRYIAFVEPFLYTYPLSPKDPHHPTTNPSGTPRTPPAGWANVKPGNPVGSPFTITPRFIDTSFMVTRTGKTGFPGYTSVGTYVYHNAIGRFAPNNGAGTPNGAPTPTRVVFPTTQGNSYPNPAMTKNINYGNGNPVTPTTTFDGNYDFDRAGSINVSAGTNRFGGTMRLLNGPGNSFYQFVFRYSPTSVFKAYGLTRCQRAGIDCTSDPDGPFGPEAIGEITSSFTAVRFLLNQNQTTGTGTNMFVASAKATTPRTPNGTVPTRTSPPFSQTGTPNGGPASYRVARNHYLHLLHPWTTGFASVYNYANETSQYNPHYEGYDKNLGGANITVTQVATSPMFNLGLGTVTYTTATYKQYLTGVQRVVSMVRPRLIHVYEQPLAKNVPFITNYQAARLWTMKVFFLPEPAGWAMLGTGIVALLGLSRIRRR